MAAKKTVKNCKVKVVTNPNFCGIDAGGVQFAYGLFLKEEWQTGSASMTVMK